MPVSISEFHSRKVAIVSKRLGRNQEVILGFLVMEDRAFTTKEIQEGTAIDYIGAVTAALKSLHSRGLVRKKMIDGITYWKGVREKIEQYLQQCQVSEENSEGEQRDIASGVEAQAGGDGPVPLSCDEGDTDSDEK